FFVVYSLVFGVGYIYMIRLIQKGPQPAETPTAETDGRPARPISAVGESLEQEKRE
ncbi:cyanide-insensitive oxidase CioA, partial [Salmonella enterica subsp. enterica serovar Bareilly str. 2780]